MQVLAQKGIVGNDLCDSLTKQFYGTLFIGPVCTWNFSRSCQEGHKGLKEEKIHGTLEVHNQSKACEAPYSKTLTTHIVTECLKAGTVELDQRLIS
jgi:hypothetical protein